MVKKWKPPKCPSTDEWIKRMWHIHTMEYYSTIKKNKVLRCARTCMNTVLNDRSQPPKLDVMCLHLQEMSRIDTPRDTEM